jgi:hypothetical protein
MNKKHMNIICYQNSKKYIPNTECVQLSNKYIIFSLVHRFTGFLLQNMLIYP